MRFFCALVISIALSIAQLTLAVSIPLNTDQHGARLKHRETENIDSRMIPPIPAWSMFPGSDVADRILKNIFHPVTPMQIVASVNDPKKTPAMLIKEAVEKIHRANDEINAIAITTDTPQSYAFDGQDWGVYPVIVRTKAGNVMYNLYWAKAGKVAFVNRHDNFAYAGDITLIPEANGSVTAVLA